MTDPNAFEQITENHILKIRIGGYMDSTKSLMGQH